jgi:hypothetical protein
MQGSGSASLVAMGGAGDKIEITSAITIAAITFRILNAGVPVDRVVNLQVQGY